MSKGAGIELGVNGGKGAALNLKGGVIAATMLPTAVACTLTALQLI